MSQTKEERQNADFNVGYRNLCSAKLLKALTKIFNTAFAVSIDRKKTFRLRPSQILCKPPM